MKAEKLKSGNWRARVVITDPYTKKRMYKSFTASTKKEAEFLAIDYANRHDKSPDIQDMKFFEALDMYIRSRENVCSPATIRGYRNLQKAAYDTVGHLLISEFDTQIIQKWINLYAVDHSPKSVKNAYGLLNAAILYCNPSFKVHVTLPQKKVISYDLPTQEQFRQLVELASPKLKKAILLGGCFGMRRGEIAALTYEDIDGDIIHVHSDMIKPPDGSWIIKDIPKTSASDRYIHAPHEIIEQLGKGKGKVVDMTPNKITYRFQVLREKIGLNCRFHDLRHFAASLYHAIGIPDVYIMQIMGWQSDNTLKSIYRNTLSDEQANFNSKINNYLQGNLLNYVNQK